MSPLPRRLFLRRALATTSLVALGSPLVFGEERAGFGLGFSLYGMKSLPLATALETCAAIGYDNVELCLLEGYPAEPKLLSAAARQELRETLAARKLRVSGLMENFTLLADEAKHAQQLERIRLAAALAHELAPESPAPLETVLGGKPAEWEAVKEKMAEQLRAWAEVAAAAKIVIALKAHILSAVQTPERLLWLLRAADSPSIRAAYDYSHFQLQNLSMEETLTALLPQTSFIHVKDGRLAADGKAEFLLPGEGTTDYSALFRSLHDRGYRGDVIVEVSGMIFKQPGYDAKTAAEKSFAALSAGMQRARLGLKR